MAKYKIDDFVRVTHPTRGTWEGLIYKVASCDDTYEYWVQGAPSILASHWPILAWESEITLLQSKEQITHT